MIILLIFSIIFSIILIIFLQRFKSQFIKNTLTTMNIIFIVDLVLINYFYQFNFFNFFLFSITLIIFHLMLIIILQSYKSSIQLQILRNVKINENFKKNDIIIFNDRIKYLKRNKIITIKNGSILVKKKSIIFIVFFFVILRNIYNIKFKN
jgi:hypothetical protein